MEKLLLIAEKPSLMRDLKDTYFKHKDELPYYIEFVALSGHVCCYANPKEYPGWDAKWQDLTLPMIPKDWIINIMDDKKKMYKDINEKIKKEKYDGIICATDSDREGNLIYHLLASKMKIGKMKTYRIWIHDQTDAELLKAYKTMVDFNRDNFQRNLTLASVLRSRFDWIIGMNITVAASLRFNMLAKIGRVKSPTLKLVYDNSMAIENFKPTTSYQVVSNYNEGFSGMLKNNDDNYFTEFKTKAEANELINKLSKNAVVTSVKKEKVKTHPKQLYKLSDIQVEASKKYGYSPAKTLELVQSLYETHKLLSYPRCDCRYISSAAIQNAPKMLSNISSVSEYKKVVDSISSSDIDAVKNNKRYVNDKEVDKNSHTALVPTDKVPDLSKLSEDEINILKMVYTRFVSIFLKPLIEEKTTILTKNNEYVFKTDGKIVVDKGFTEYFPSKTSKQEDNLPDIKENEKVTVKEFSVKEKTTTPPQRLTDGTLIDEMISIGKRIDDNDLKQIMKQTAGIGTQATRANIISELIKDDYIEVKKSKKVNNLYISEKGKIYIENLMGTKIINPELTAEWEQKLKEVEQGERDAVAFNKEMMSFLNEIMEDIKNSTKVRVYSAPQRTVLGKCPRCGKDIIEGKRSYGCVGYRDEPKCDFSIWKDNGFFKSQGKKLTSAIIEKLLNNKDHKVLVKGFKSKKGNKYDAYIILKDPGKGFANLDVEMPKRK